MGGHVQGRSWGSMAARALAGGTCSLWAAPAVQPSACLRSALRLRPTAARCPLALHTPQAEAEEEGKTRVIYVDRQAQAGAGRKFESNRVVTSKYNIITFLPIFLFEMFSRVAYLYFLLQVRPPPVTAGCTAAAAAWCAVGATAGAPEAPPAAPADPPPPPSARPPRPACPGGVSSRPSAATAPPPRSCLCWRWRRSRRSGRT